jgi:aminomethyltransferase
VSSVSYSGPVLERTVLHAEHVARGADLVDFHGWEMPLSYGAIPDEHRRVRQSAGIFDLGHMGRLRVRGRDAERWLQSVLTNDLARLRVGDARYTLLCNDAGGILDDAIVYRLADEWLLVVNASNRRRDIEWIQAHRQGADAVLTDATHDWAMVAVQGPAAWEIAAPLFEACERPWSELRYYQIARGRFDGAEVLVARTGYTGEDGLEVYLPAQGAPALWRRLLAAGGDRIAPIGLGARDTLRLEAGMPLYGNDIDETTTPFEAGLGFAVKLDKAVPFAGQARLRKALAAGPRRQLVGFVVEGRRVARQGMKVYLDGDTEVGRITSGAPSPSLGFPIALGYLDTGCLAGLARPELEVDVRGRREKLRVEPLPFCSRTRKKGT